MNELKTINKDKLHQLFDKLIADGNDVIAPKRKSEKVFFGKIISSSDISYDYIQTAFSAKSSVFPKCEELFSYEKNDNEIKHLDPVFSDKTTIVFGSRPCDSASFDYLKVFFLKENPDFHFAKRYDSTLLISMTCNKSDEHCFCTSVGISPSDTKGSDVSLTDLENGEFLAEIISDKGKKFVAEYSSFFENKGDISQKSNKNAKVDIKFDLDKLKSKIKGSFDWDTWDKQSLACLGCGACAFACPTCTCFDIQDEANPKSGSRIRIWDTCALSLFTLHASGHNPRENQAGRWRNRVLHKFEYTDTKFDMVSCVGCGRCIRTCPASMNIINQVISIMEA